MIDILKNNRLLAKTTDQKKNNKNNEHKTMDRVFRQQMQTFRSDHPIEAQFCNSTFRKTVVIDLSYFFCASNIIKETDILTVTHEVLKMCVTTHCQLLSE